MPRFGPAFPRGAAKMPAETGGEILAGGKPAFGGDRGDLGSGFGAEPPGGLVEPAAVEIIHRALVADPAAKLGETGAAHAAMPGHASQGPWRHQLFGMALKIGEKQFDRAVPRDQLRILLLALPPQHLQQTEQQAVDLDEQAGGGNGRWRPGNRLLRLLDAAASS